MDTLTPEQRHRVMSAIHSGDTTPEMIVRKYLFSLGFRYRIHSSRLPGKPDLVLRKYRTCVFVNGCFWHGHEGCRFFRLPLSNAGFWASKIARNVERDKRNLGTLGKAGWRCLTVWECELKPATRLATLEGLASRIRKGLGLPKPRKIS